METGLVNVMSREFVLREYIQFSSGTTEVGGPF